MNSMSFATWGDATVATLQNVWAQFVNAVPLVLGAAVVLTLGLVLARMISWLIHTVAKRTPLDEIVERTGVPERIRQGGLSFTSSGFLASVGYWFVVLVTLSVMAQTLGWNTLGDIIAYTPTLLLGMAIVVVGFIAARIAHDLVEGALRSTGVTGTGAEMVAGLARVSVMVFSTMAALTQLGVASDVMRILIIGAVGAMAIGFGVAFGLAGQQQASHLLLGVADSLRSHHVHGPRRRAA
jgi:hypothetical protein